MKSKPRSQKKTNTDLKHSCSTRMGTLIMPRKHYGVWKNLSIPWTLVGKCLRFVDISKPTSPKSKGCDSFTQDAHNLKT